MKFDNPSQEFVYTRTYSRWLDDKKRRETWEETVKRYIDFIREECGDKIPDKVYKKVEERILKMEVLPSMRMLWAAGPALKKDNTCGYNCAFANVDSIKAFSEALYILMCGVGYGFAITKKSISKLVPVPNIDWINKEYYLIEDSREGWANSVKFLLEALFSGKSVIFDYSLIRPKGARLYTMGGRSSGPEPLIILHNFIMELFQTAQGRKLNSLECLDIMNQIASIVVVGGVRRSSQISLSDLDDNLIRNAKNWPFPERRRMSNNSAIYYDKPTAPVFLKEWASLAESGTGERGISNMHAAHKNAPKRRDAELIEGFNPCHEIALRSKQFCNLSTIIVKENDDLDELLDKTETAIWIGSLQSTFTNFTYLSKEWKKNCEEERLLGVSISGQMDNPSLLTVDALKAMKARAIKVAKKAAELLNINMPTAITCVKPEGTTSQLVNSSSGLHARYSAHYIRRYRIAAIDPLCKMLKDLKVPMNPEAGQEKLPESKINTWVVEFPIKSPKHSITRDKLTAIDQLEWYKKIQTNWCEHNASATIYCHENDWFNVGNWVYENWDIVCGVSFLPYSGGHYKLAPYEEISKEEYEKLIKEFPKIDYSLLSKYEMEDNTEGAKSLACSGDSCELT